MTPAPAAATVTLRTALDRQVLHDLGVPIDGLGFALEELNRRVAGLLAKPPKHINVEFYYMPALAQEAWGKHRRGVILGCADPRATEPIPIALLIQKRWRNTLIHELCHVYSIGASEAIVKRLTASVIRHLKSGYWDVLPKQETLL